jgi:hypothetical protein
MEGSTMPRRLTRCEAGTLAPLIVVCRHLLENPRQRWVEVESGHGAEASDWICRDCARIFPAIPEHDLVAACMHCARRMREAG